MKTNFSYLLFNEVVPIEVQRNFPFYFGDGKYNLRYSGFMYDYGFDLVQSESFINIDFGLKHQIKFFLPFFYCFYPFYFKSSSLLFWKEFKYLLFRSLPVVDLKLGFDSFFFRSTFPLSFYTFSVDLNLGLVFNFSDSVRDMWLSKNIVNKLWYDTYLDVDNHISLALIAGGVPSLKFGYLTTHFLDLTALTLVSDFKPGVSFFLNNFDNKFMKIFRKFVGKKVTLKKNNRYKLLVNSKSLLKKNIYLKGFLFKYNYFFRRLVFYDNFSSPDFYFYFIRIFYNQLLKLMLYKLNWYVIIADVTLNILINYFVNIFSTNLFYKENKFALSCLKEAFKEIFKVKPLTIDCFWNGFRFIPISLKVRKNKKLKNFFGIWVLGVFYLLTIRLGFWDKYEHFIPITDEKNLKYNTVKILDIKRYKVVRDNGMLKSLFGLKGFWYRHCFIWLFDVHESMFNHFKVKKSECFLMFGRFIAIQHVNGFWKGNNFKPLNCWSEYLDFVFSKLYYLYNRVKMLKNFKKK